jgi:hypothetical protein
LDLKQDRKQDNIWFMIQLYLVLQLNKKVNKLIPRTHCTWFRVLLHQRKPRELFAWIMLDKEKFLELSEMMLLSFYPLWSDPGLCQQRKLCLCLAAFYTTTFILTLVCKIQTNIPVNMVNCPLPSAKTNTL